MLKRAEVVSRLEHNDLVVRPKAIMEKLEYGYVELHFDDRIFKFNSNYYVDFDKSKTVKMVEHMFPSDGYVLKPQEFILATTLENIKMPIDLFGCVEVQPCFGEIGVMVYCTSGYVYPGYQDKISLGIKNLNNIDVVLHSNMLIGRMCFVRVG